MKKNLKLGKPKTIEITYWWHPFMYTLIGPSNTWYAPMKLSEKRNLLYRINVNKKTIERFVVI